MARPDQLDNHRITRALQEDSPSFHGDSDLAQSHSVAALNEKKNRLIEMFRAQYPGLNKQEAAYELDQISKDLEVGPVMPFPGSIKTGRSKRSLVGPSKSVPSIKKTLP